VYEKLENPLLQPFWDRPRSLFVRHSFPNSEKLDLLFHVVVVNVEPNMLSQLSLSVAVRAPRVPDINRQLSHHPDFTEGKEER